MPEIAQQLVESEKSARLTENSIWTDPIREPIVEFSTSQNRTGYFWQLLKVGIPLALSDAIAVTTAMSVAFLITITLGKQINHFPLFLMGTVAAFSLYYWSTGLYPGVGLHPARELKQLFRGTLSATISLSLGLLLLSDVRSPYLWMVLIGFPVILVLLPPTRSITKAWMRRCGIGIQFFFMGKRSDVKRVFEDMSRFGWTTLIPIGRFSIDPETQEFNEGKLLQNSALDLKFERQVVDLGTPDELLAAAVEKSVYWLFVVDDSGDSLRPNFHSAHFHHFPEIVMIHPPKTYAGAGSSVLCCGLASGVRVEESLQLCWPRIQKRILDIIVAGGGLLVLAPILLLIAVLIRLSGPGPIFYGSTRIGVGGKRFRAWKYRSMVQNADVILKEYLEKHPDLKSEWDRESKLKNDPRITLIGRIIRKTSLDEIPQLWNVIVGEMSLVGPRPILPHEQTMFEGALDDYLRVRPGITGLWQVSGRNKTEYVERLTYTSFYVRHWSPWLDIYILMRTIRTVLLCEGAY